MALVVKKGKALALRVGNIKIAVCACAAVFLRLLNILLPICILLIGTGAYAQRITDSGFRTIAHLKSDGTIQDASFKVSGYFKKDGSIQDSSFRTIGYLKDNGAVQDRSFRTIGYIKADGTVQDSGFRTIGYVRKDGIIQDASFRTIGHADGIPLKWAAYFFFFQN